MQFFLFFFVHDNKFPESDPRSHDKMYVAGNIIPGMYMYQECTVLQKKQTNTETIQHALLFSTWCCLPEQKKKTTKIVAAAVIDVYVRCACKVLTHTPTPRPRRRQAWDKIK